MGNNNIDNIFLFWTLAAIATALIVAAAYLISARIRLMRGLDAGAPSHVASLQQYASDLETAVANRAQRRNLPTRARGALVQAPVRAGVKLSLVAADSGEENGRQWVKFLLGNPVEGQETVEAILLRKLRDVAGTGTAAVRKSAIPGLLLAALKTPTSVGQLDDDLIVLFERMILYPDAPVHVLWDESGVKVSLDRRISPGLNLSATIAVALTHVSQILGELGLPDEPITIGVGRDMLKAPFYSST